MDKFAFEIFWHALLRILTDKEKPNQEMDKVRLHWRAEEFYDDFMEQLGIEEEKENP